MKDLILPRHTVMNRNSKYGNTMNYFITTIFHKRPSIFRKVTNRLFCVLDMPKWNATTFLIRTKIDHNKSVSINEPPTNCILAQTSLHAQMERDYFSYSNKD